MPIRKRGKYYYHYGRKIKPSKFRITKRKHRRKRKR